MAGIKILKTNGYASFIGNEGHVRIGKTLAYASYFAIPGHLFLAKTNAYASEFHNPGHIFLAKLNGYGSESSDFALPADHEVIIPKFELREMERNPYRAHVAEDEATRVADLREQQRILREQHNFTQAGDTTFDYGLLLKSYPNPEFTLGSLGRFFHDDYGLILARFVQFKDCVDHDYQGQPVGRLKFNTEKVLWRVTNDITKSDPDLIFGFTFFAETPPDGYYGWAVVAGPNPAQIQLDWFTRQEQNWPYSWTATGKLTPNARGRICARLWGSPKRALLEAGSLFIGLEGQTDKDIQDMIRENLTEEFGALSVLGQDLITINERVDQLIISIGVLSNANGSLATSLATKVESLSQQVQALQGQLGAGLQAAVNTAMDTIRQEFMNADTGILGEIQNTLNIANSTKTYLAMYNLQEMQDSIDNLAYQLGAISLTAKPAILPVVDGSIPPTFIQNPDGGLVYVEIL